MVARLSRAVLARLGAGTLLAASIWVGPGLATGAPVGLSAQAFVAPPAVKDVNANSVGSGNLFGGRNEALAVNPVNRQIVLAAVELGGLWRSNDAGAHWAHVDGLPLTSMDDVQFAASDPSLVIATGEYDGAANVTGAEIYRSTDGGFTWARATTSPCGAGNPSSAHKIAIGAGTPGNLTIFVATDCGLVESTNSGGTWANLDPFSPNANQYWDVKIRGTGPNFTVDTCGAFGFFRSTNGGTSWSAFDAAGPIRGGAGNGYLPCRITTAPQDANVVFLASPIRTPSPSDGINETQILENDNGGAAGSWTSLNGSSDGNGRPPNVITAPGFDGNANHFELFYATDQVWLHQQCDITAGPPRCAVGNGNNGGAFSVYDSSVPHNAPDASSLAFGGDGCPFLTSGDGGVFSTTNGCNSSPSFTPANVGLHGLQSTGGAGTSYSGHTDLYFGTQDNGIWDSLDGGATWGQGGPDVFGVLADQDGPPSRVAWKICCFTGGGAVTAKLEVANQDLSGTGDMNLPPGQFPAFGNIIGSQFGNQRYALVTSTGGGTPIWRVYVTTNEGGAWTQMGPDLPSGPTPAQLVASGPPASPTFYLLDGGLYRLSGPLNGTATLTQIGAGLTSAANIAVKPSDPLQLYAVDLGGTPSVKKSINGGDSFTPDAAITNLATNNGFFALNGSGGSFVTAIGLDGASSTVLVGTIDNGVFASVDGGQTWSQLSGSVAISRATGFFFDEKTGKAYTSSAGRGMWEIDLPHADLSVTKTHSPEPVIAGTLLTWHVSVTNNGPDAAPNVVVKDTLPPQAKYLANTLNPPAGCSAIGSVVTCSLGDMANGQTINFDIQTLVDKSTVAAAGGPTSITNNVTVSSSAVIDPNLANNSAADTAIVNDSADLAVTKICKPDTTIYAGQPIQCTVYVDNHGPSDARQVVVTDVVRGNPVVPLTVTGFPGFCTLSSLSDGQQLVCSLGTVTAATTTDPGRKSFDYQVTSNEGTNIDNLATVRSDTPDPDSTNNSVTVSLTVTAVADLALGSTVPASVVAGTNMSYVLTITNGGPSTAKNIVLQDSLPAGESLVSVTPSTGSCTSGTPGNPLLPTTCAFGSQAPGGPAITVTITVHVLPDTTGTLNHSARVSADTFDSNIGNNLADHTTTVTAQADLAATMTASPNPVVAGTTLTYRTTVTNNGPSVAAATTLTQNLPAGTTFSAFHIVGGGGSCSLLTISQLGCSLGTLALSQSVDVYVDVLVASSVPTGTLLTSSATASSSASDTIPANNTASASSTVSTSADLGISLTSDTDVYKPSTTIHYTITVTNAGPSDAQNVVVTVQLPPAKSGSYVSNNAGCPAPSGTVFTCSLGTIAASGLKTFQLNFFIQGNKGLITSTATVTSSTPDPNLANNTSVRNVTVK